MAGSRRPSGGRSPNRCLGLIPLRSCLVYGRLAGPWRFLFFLRVGRFAGVSNLGLLRSVLRPASVVGACAYPRSLPDSRRLWPRIELNPDRICWRLSCCGCGLAEIRGVLCLGLGRLGLAPRIGNPSGPRFVAWPRPDRVQVTSGALICAASGAFCFGTSFRVACWWFPFISCLHAWASIWIRYVIVSVPGF